MNRWNRDVLIRLLVSLLSFPGNPQAQQLLRRLASPGRQLWKSSKRQSMKLKLLLLYSIHETYRIIQMTEMQKSLSETSILWKERRAATTCRKELCGAELQRPFVLESRVDKNLLDDTDPSRTIAPLLLSNSQLPLELVLRLAFVLASMSPRSESEWHYTLYGGDIDRMTHHSKYHFCHLTVSCSLSNISMLLHWHHPHILKPVYGKHLWQYCPRMDSSRKRHLHYENWSQIDSTPPELVPMSDHRATPWGQGCPY